MSVNFPSSPTQYQRYTYNNRTFIYIGDGWRIAASGNVTSSAVLGADNCVLRSDGATGKRAQGSDATISDAGNLSGLASVSATTIELGHASDTTLARIAPGRVSIEGSELFTEVTHPTMNAYGLAATLTSSGSQVDITGLPANIRRITVALYNTSVDGVNQLTLRLGTSGGIVSTGYNSTALQYNDAGNATHHDETTGFTFRVNNTAHLCRGGFVLMRNTSHQWVYYAAGGHVNVTYAGGSVDLGAELTQMRFLPTAGSFDQGRLNVFWEF